MDKLKQQIDNELILLNYINEQTKVIEKHIINLKRELYNICPHKNVEKKNNYYDYSTTMCLDCGYEY